MENSAPNSRIQAVLDNISTLDLRYFLKGGFWLGTGYLGIAGIRLLQIVAFAHLADKTFYGQYQFITSILATTLIFSLPGMDAAITQSVASGHPSSLIAGTKAKIRWGILGSLVFLAIGGFFKFAYPQPFWPVFLFAAPLFPLYSGFSGTISYHRGRENFKTATICETAIMAASVFAAIIALVITRSLFWIIISLMASGTVVSYILYRNARKEIPPEPTDPHVISYGRNLTFVNFLNYLAPYTDRFIITAIVGFEALAVYTVAMSAVLYLAISGKLMSVLLLPKFSKPKPHHVSKIKTLFIPVLLGMAFLVGAGIILAPAVMPIVFSQKYAESVVYTQVALISLVFQLPCGIFTSYFQAGKRTKLLYAYHLGNGVLNILLLSILVPLLGIMGAVIGKIILEFISFTFLTTSFYLTTKY